MNKKGVVLSVIITALLAVATWWATRPSAAAPAGPRPMLPGLTPESVRSMDIMAGPGRTQSLRPGPLPEMWLLGSPGSAQQPGEPAASWVVDPATVRAAIRVLCEAQGEEIITPNGTVGSPDTPSVDLHLDGDRLIQLHFAAATLGGRVAVSVNQSGPIGPKASPRSLLVPASLAQMFSAASIDAWRSRRMMPIELTASRIRLTGSTRSCALSKVGASWAIIEPALGRGDDQAVNELGAKIAGLDISKFADPGLSDTETGFTDPSSAVIVESDRRSVVGDAVQRQVVVQEVTIGGRADIGGQSIFVRLTGRVVHGDSQKIIAAWGPIVAIAEAAKLTGISTEPLAYVDRRALAVPAADIKGLEFRTGPAAETGSPSAEPVTLMQRTGEGWTWSAKGDKPVPVPPDDLRLTQLLLKLLTEQRADQVGPVGKGELPDLLAEVMVLGPDGSGQAMTIGLRRADEGTAAGLLVRTQNFERSYAVREYAGLINWLRARVNVPR